jgi:hypothetical protein
MIGQDGYTVKKKTSIALFNLPDSYIDKWDICIYYMNMCKKYKTSNIYI